MDDSAFVGTSDSETTTSLGNARGDSSIRELALSLHKLGRELHTQFSDRGLHAVQWSALRFYANAARNENTVSGLARYQGTTLGSASRTVSTLVNRGLLVPTTDPNDRRTKLLSVSEAGQQILSYDPLQRLEHALSLIPEDAVDLVHESIDAALVGLVNQRNAPERRIVRPDFSQSERA